MEKWTKLCPIGLSDLGDPDVDKTVRGYTVEDPERPKIGEPRHIKGFILNKLYLGGYFAKRGGRHHGKHTSIKNLPKGYAPKYRGDFPGIVDELRRDGLLLVFPSGGEKHVCAVLETQKIESGLLMVNAFRRSTGLLPLDRGFREIANRSA